MNLTFIRSTVKRLYNGDFELTLIIPRKHAPEIEQYEKRHRDGDAWDAELKRHRDKRSNDANSYCWTLLGKIADTLADMPHKGRALTKEDIYRSHIKDVGVYTPLPIREDAVERFCEAWEKKGIGWFAEVVDDSKLDGYKKVFAYYGSSTYNTKEMSRLIDNIVQDCKSLGIETLPPYELDRLKEEWK